MSDQFTQPVDALILFVLVIFFLSIFIVVKGVALWKAARNSSKPWFIVLLLVNSVGILDLIYIFLISKRSNDSVNVSQTQEQVTDQSNVQPVEQSGNL